MHTQRPADTDASPRAVGAFWPSQQCVSHLGGGADQSGEPASGSEQLRMSYTSAPSRACTRLTPGPTRY
jgi:hypothetical protein